MIYCIIPARGGSKRLSRKNIYPVLGKPMIFWTLEAASESSYIDKKNIFISTEDKEIADLCKDYNLLERPAHLAQDNVWTQEVVNHFIQEKQLEENDIIVLLQANSPEINTKTIDLCIEKLIKNNLWQVHTVDQNYINNGAVHVYYSNVKDHKGKVNYNGVVMTDWIDVHHIEDVIEVEKKILKRKE